MPIHPVIPQDSGKSSAEHATQQALLKVNWTPPKLDADQEEDNLLVTDSLKVSWDPSKAVVSDDEEVEEELEQLRVKWKARMPVEDEEKETVNPLKINWTARVPDEGNEEESEEEMDQFKVKWKARVPVEDNEERQVNPLKVNWTAQVPAEDNVEEEEEEGDPVPVVKWKAKQVLEPEEEIPKVHWTVHNVGDPHQSRKQQRPSSDNSATQSLRGNLTPPSQRPKAAANSLKIQWDPSKASPTSSEEDLSSQGSGESPQLQRASRYSAGCLFHQ